MKVLMCGPVARSGGVAAHTRHLINSLKKMDVGIEFYLITGSSFNKIFQRTFGLFLFSIKMKKIYDIIHIQASGGYSSFLSAISGSIASIVLHKPLLITFHHSQTEEFVRRYSRSFKIILDHSNALIAVSDNQKGEISKIFAEYSDHIVVIPNGYDSKVFYPREKEKCREKLGLPVDATILFNVGNLLEVKGHKYLIEAMQLLSRERHDIFCYIAGSGKLHKEFEDSISNQNLQNVVHLIGWCPDDEIALWMNACDLFVLPSLSESFGIVQIEAMACGKPVVATRNGGSEEIIISSNYGYLCRTARSEDLAANILLALDKEWNQKDIVEYSKRYTWKRVAEMTLNIYQESV